MRSGSVRFVVGAFAGLALIFVAAGSAAAQSTQTAFGESLKTATFTVNSPAKPMRARFMAAQDASEDNQGIGIGVLGMLTFAKLDDEIFDYSARTGGGVGLWVGGNRNGRVGFTGEFIYVVRNSKDEFDNEYSFHAFDIPAVFHINFGSRSRDAVGGYIVVGPSFSFNLKQKFNGVTVEDDDKFKGANIGIIVGAGVEFFRIGIEGRGNWGLRSISPEGDVVETKTRSIEILGKFAFN